MLQNIVTWLKYICRISIHISSLLVYNVEMDVHVVHPMFRSQWGHRERRKAEHHSTCAVATKEHRYSVNTNRHIICRQQGGGSLFHEETAGESTSSGWKHWFESIPIYKGKTVTSYGKEILCSAAKSWWSSWHNCWKNDRIIRASRRNYCLGALL